jgi:hypothetical protein
VTALIGNATLINGSIVISCIRLMKFHIIWIERDLEKVRKDLYMNLWMTKFPANAEVSTF